MQKKLMTLASRLTDAEAVELHAALARRVRRIQREGGGGDGGPLGLLKTFLAEECVVAPDQSCECLALWDRWTASVEKLGLPSGTRIGFGRQLIKAIPQMERVYRGPRDGRRWFYEGVGLKPVR